MFAATPCLKITDERTLKIVRKLKGYDVALERIKFKIYQDTNGNIQAIS